MDDLTEQARLRREKLIKLQQEGHDPFGHTRFDRTHQAAALQEHFDELDGREVAVCGRLMRRNELGKLCFADLVDGSGRVQLSVRRDVIGDQGLAQFLDLDLGDIIGASGTLFRTRRGEVTVEVARHELLAKGLRPLALILGTPNLSTTQDRLAGCRRAAEEFGLGPEDLLLKVGFGRTAQGYEAALECLDANPRPQAIFAFNNLMAEAALMAIHQRGVRCPADIALMGFDDFRSAAALTPPLSVVEQNPVQMGAKAVEELARVIETGEPSQALTSIPTRLVIRASCGCAMTQQWGHDASRSLRGKIEPAECVPR